jgi:ankyrin repeat protein
MSILDNLKKLSGFPVLNKDAIESLKKSLDKDISKIQRIPKAIRLPEEISLKSALKKDLALYDELLLLLKIKTPQSAYDVLTECEIPNLDADTLHELISYWQEKFNSALQHEQNPLSLSYLLSSKAANPILLVALIHSLIQKGSTANDLLLSSPLLYRYVLVNISVPDKISAVYELLEQTQSFSDPAVLTTLCTQAKTTTAVKTRRSDFTLSGSTLYHQAEDVSGATLMHNYVPTTSISLTADNLKQLASLFAAEEFLLYLLQLPSSAELNQYLTTKITTMPVAEVNALYQYILSSVAEEQRSAMLEKFSSYLTNDQVLELITKQQDFFWIVLFSNPALLKELDAASLSALVNNNPITLANMDYALKLLKYPELQSYNDDIHLSALQCLLQNPTVEVPKSVQSSFKKHPQASRWCKDFNDQILANFNQDILANLPLTEHSYINITDSYNNKLPQWRMLEKLSPLPLHYPHDVYGAQGCIMKELLDKGILTPECLDIFHPAYKYETYKEESESYRIAAKERSLLACLTEQNDALLQDWVIQAISEAPYNKSNLQSCVINNVPIIDIALTRENATFIKRYYSLFPADITKKDNNGNTALHLAALYPESLKAILELLPENERLLAVKEKNNNGDTVLHKALYYPKLLRVILELLPEDARIAVFNEKNDNGDTSLHQVAYYPESLRVILDLYPENERLAAVKEKNNDGDTLLHKATSYPESLRVILDLYPENERLTAVKEKNIFGNTLLHNAANNPESLRVILDLYPENERLAAVKEKNNNGDTLLHKVTSYPESLRVILDLYPENERLAAVKEKNNSGDSIFSRALSYPLCPDLLMVIRDIQSSVHNRPLSAGDRFFNRQAGVSQYGFDNTPPNSGPG